MVAFQTQAFVSHPKEESLVLGARNRYEGEAIVCRVLIARDRMDTLEDKILCR